MPGEIKYDAAKRRRQWETMLVEILDLMIRRYERNPDYHFIDMKFNTISGEDFPAPANPDKDFKSRGVVFGWIQGRGLEALVGHAQWLDECRVLDAAGKSRRKTALDRMIGEVFTKLEDIRRENHGRLFFTMTPDGKPFEIDTAGKRRGICLDGRPAGYSDLFYVKGMMAAANHLGDEEKMSEAREMMRAVCADIDSGRFLSDQVSFDPKNKVKPIPGKLSQGPRMIAIAGLTLFAETTGGTEWFEQAMRFIEFILDHHAETGDDGDERLKPYDFWEFIHAEDKSKWIENDALSSIPGHTIEFVGFAAKLLLTARRLDRLDAFKPGFIERCSTILPGVFIRNFDNGFNPEVGGIRKEFDLLSRKPLNEDMPWWCSPETIRAAGNLLALYPEDARATEISAALAKTSDGFFKRYINWSLNQVAYQTIGADGNPVDVIPATPDADPGYHTGLSIIDFLRASGIGKNI